jgi:hypothetical protein
MAAQSATAAAAAEVGRVDWTDERVLQLALAHQVNEQLFTARPSKGDCKQALGAGGSLSA